MRPMLLLFTAKDCPACAAAIPEFERFKGRNPMQMALQLDADGPYVESMGMKQIRETPLYVLRLAEEGVTHVGLMKAEALEKWIRGIEKG